MAERSECRDVGKGWGGRPSQLNRLAGGAYLGQTQSSLCKRGQPTHAENRHSEPNKNNGGGEERKRGGGGRVCRSEEGVGLGWGDRQTGWGAGEGHQATQVQSPGQDMQC